MNVQPEPTPTGTLPEPSPAVEPIAPAATLGRRISVPEPLTRFVAKLAFELLVVFIGVSLAFFVENRRQASNNAAQARQTYAALAAELADHATIGQRVLNEYLQRQKEWDDAFARGERPLPWFIPWNSAGPPRAAWDATLAGGGVGLIDRSIFYELAKYYRIVEVYMVPVDGPDAFADAEIVPHLDEGPNAFYVSGEHQLKPKYQAYLDRRRAVLAGMQDGLRKARTLLAEVEKRAEGQIASAHP